MKVKIFDFIFGWFLSLSELSKNNIKCLTIDCEFVNLVFMRRSYSKYFYTPCWIFFNQKENHFFLSHWLLAGRNWVIWKKIYFKVTYANSLKLSLGKPILKKNIQSKNILITLLLKVGGPECDILLWEHIFLNFFFSVFSRIRLVNIAKLCLTSYSWKFLLVF